MNAPFCASMFIDYAKDYMSQYSLSWGRADRDVLSTENDCAVLATRPHAEAHFTAWQEYVYIVRWVCKQIFPGMYSPFLEPPA